MTLIVDDRIIGTWWMQVTPDQDVMMGVRHAEAPGEIELVWRFRYFHGTVAEHKNWYRSVGAKTEAEAIAGVRAALAKLREASPGLPPADELLMGEGGLPAFIKGMEAFADITGEISGTASPEEALAAFELLKTTPAAGRA